MYSKISMYTYCTHTCTCIHTCIYYSWCFIFYCENEDINYKIIILYCIYNIVYTTAYAGDFNFFYTSSILLNTIIKYTRFYNLTLC